MIADFEAYAKLETLIGQLQGLLGRTIEDLAEEQPDGVKRVRQEMLDRLRGETHNHMMMLREMTQTSPVWREPIPMKRSEPVADSEDTV